MRRFACAVITTAGFASAAALAFVRRAIFERVVHEIGDRLADQLAIAANAQPILGVDCQRHALFLGDRLVKLGRRSSPPRRRRPAERPEVAAGFRAGDQKERVENADELVRFLDRLLQRLAIGRGVAAESKRGFGVVAQAGEGRAQVMGDVVGNLAASPPSVRRSVPASR